VGTNAVTVEVGRGAGKSEQLLKRFAELMQERYGARIYVFGSRARKTEHKDSDYDVVAVAEAFAAQPRTRRVTDRRPLWRQSGGWGIGLDLHCYTPDEFRAELRGLGYLGQARRRGELREVAIGGDAKGRSPSTSETTPVKVDQ
jgi:hypothetical protein